MNIKTTMTKTMLGLSLAWLTLCPLSGQQAVVVDGTTDFFGRTTQDLSKLPKMERDIVILQNVLNDLFSSDRHPSFSSPGAKGMYISGKGVIFNVNYGNRYGHILFAVDIKVVNAEENDVPDSQEENKRIEEKIESLSQEFLVNYGSILSELKSSEKVMLNVEYNKLKPVDTLEKSGVTIRPSGQNLASTSRAVIRGYTSKSSNVRMASSINYSDINSYLNGKLNLEQAMNKVNVTNGASKESNAPDAKIMAGILDDIFQSNFDGKFRRSRKTTWTYFEGFGLMYDLNMSNGSGLFFGTNAQNIAILKNDDAKSPKEDKADIEIEKEAAENLDELINIAKESLITYGRTLRSVKSEEVVILNINLGGSFGRLKLPKSVRLQVTKSQIDSYARGQKSLEQLKQEIDTKLLKASASNFPTVQGYVNQAQSIYSTTPNPTGRVVVGQKVNGQN